ncbi:MAG: glycosyltransferase family 2 protein [Betaproteobacteria bacterium]|nr:glycosyltransferase family 2 protein [Betaproteobacteria bacterium]
MSTYNGERYVAEQLRSILEQLPADGRILIRDDGSSDGTVAAIRALGDNRINVTSGPNVGFGCSFLTLLAAAPLADMVMFSDQDDVWLPGKIARAWQHLQPLSDRPALYGSAQMLADAELRPLRATPPWPRGPSLANALTENIITGCTAALNRSAVDLLQRAGVPEGVHFHDWWMYLVVSAFGTVVFDDEPTLLYRQHGGNQIGHGVGWFARYAGIVRFLLRNDWVGILLAQVAAFFRHYGDELDPASRLLILDLFDVQGSNAAPRWRLICGTQRLRQRSGDDLALRVLLPIHVLHIWPLPSRRL